MYIEQRKRGPIPKQWYEDIEIALNAFIENFDFNGDNTLFENEGSSGDPEASYLSQLIFRNLFVLFGIKAEFVCKIYLKVQNYDFYFDIMNNPKYKNKRNNKQNRPGKKIEEKFQEKYEEWCDIYHTLGNFTPYPKMKIDNINVQKYHESQCYERWDLVLLKLQEEWINYKEIPFSFAEYLICTGQIIYDKNVFDKIPTNEEITLDWYKEQMKWVLNNPIKLINFNNDSNSKIIDDSNVEFTIDAILKLIRVRTKIIIILLKERKKDSNFVLSLKH